MDVDEKDPKKQRREEPTTMPPPPPPTQMPSTTQEDDDDDDDDHKPEPISLEELRDKMREREKLLSRPTFMTKEQRQQIALKKREEEAKKRQEKLAEIQKQRDSLFSASSSSSLRRDDRAKEPVVDKSKDEKDISAEELNKIKIKYLGAPPVKKKVIKASEKFKYTFAWEATEDTSPDTNPLYNKPYEAQLLFGRGFRAGIDSREQITKQIDYEEICKDQGKNTQTREKEEQKRREKEAARERKEKEERERRKQKIEERKKELIEKVIAEDEDEDGSSPSKGQSGPNATTRSP